MLDTTLTNHTLPASAAELAGDPDAAAHLSAFLDALGRDCGDQIARVVLFGSRARGDHGDESDIDLLIVTRNGKDDVERRVDTLHERDTFVISALVYSAQDYQHSQWLQDPLYVEIRRDGVELWDPAAAAREAGAVPLQFLEGEPRPLSEPTRRVIEGYLNLADEELRDAQVLTEAQSAREATSRAYFAVYHAAIAALYAFNVVRGKHADIRDAVHQFLVQPGYIEADYQTPYDALFAAWRDRGAGRPVSLKDAARSIASAGRFVARVELFLRARGGVR